MVEGSLSRRYAKALFQLALEGNQEERVGQEIERLVAVYEASPLAAALNNPAFAVRNRKNVLVQVARELKLSELVVHFLSLLLERDRLAFIPSIVSRYRRLLDEKKGRVEARVAAVAPLEADVLARLGEALKKVSGKEVILHQQSDPELIGGMVLELEGRLYDGSVRTQLAKMKERMARGY